MRILSLSFLPMLLLAACAQAPMVSEPPPPATDPPAQGRNEPVMCSNPRPEMCTMIYAPVCATRDTGVRCITTPCPSTEQVTKSSGCDACSDAKVVSYVKGECPAH
ncbi:MAG: hypothetical protein ABI588_06390 [Arenimonas sp.]